MARRKTPHWFQNRAAARESLETLSAEAAGLLAYRPASLSEKQCKTLSALVFEVAAYRLPDAQTNEFWPHFRRELARLSGGTFTISDVARVFRSALRGAFPDRLDEIRSSGVRAYYIALIFEQAGIGANRKGLIGSFLYSLLGLIRGGGNLDAIRPAETVASFRQGNPHEQALDPLIPVLTEISTAVLGFARFLRNRPDRLELAELGWSELASIWRRSSGIDPDSLTPSAQDLLHEVVRGLARTITRDEAFRCLHEGRLRISVPGDDPNALRTASSPMDFPIGPAMIEDALGSRSVVLLDDPNFPPEVLAGLAGKGWQETDEGLVFRVEAEPFAESTPDGRRIAAVPLWKGETPRAAVSAGLYWGGHFATPGAVIPRSRITSRLWIRSTLRVYEGRLRLYVNWFSAPPALESDEATLSVGSRDIWSGRVAEGRPSNFAPLKLNLEPSDLEETSIRLCLRTATDASVCTTINAAFLNEAAFLVCDGQVVPALSEFPLLPRDDGSLEELILYRTDAIAVNATGAAVTKEVPCELAGWRFVATHLCLDSESGGRIQILAGLTEWNLAVHRKVYFRTDGAERMQLGDVTVIGSAAVIPVLRDALPNLVLENAAGWPNESAPPDLVLHFRAGRSLSLPLDSSHLQRIDGTWKIDVGGALAHHKSHLAPGPLEVGLGIWARPPDQWIAFFIFHEPPVVLPCRLGSPSTLIPAKGAEWPAVSSGWTVDRLALDSRRIAAGTMLCGTASLTFQWLPKVEDLIVGAQENWEGRDRLIHLNAIGAQTIPAQAIGPVGSEWNLDIAGEHLTIPSGTTQDIKGAILAAARSTGGQVIGIEARLSSSTQPAVKWHINAAPRTSAFAFNWSDAPSNAIAILTCEFTVHSAIPATAVVEFLASGRVAVSRTVALEPTAEGAMSLIVSGDIVLRPVDGDIVGSVIVRGLNEGVLFFTYEVLAPAARGTTETDLGTSRTAAAQLLRTYCEHRSESIGEALLLQILLHASAYHELPVSGTILQQRLRGGTEQTPTDALLSYCVAVVQSILAENAVPIVGGDFSQCTPVLRALACSLQVFHCHVMSMRGLLVPSRLALPLASVAQLADVVASGRWRNWCSAAHQFGALRISLDTGAVDQTHDETVRSKVLRDPLARIYEPFAEWLKTG